MITVDQQNLVFTLHTRRTTYQMKAGRHGVLLHTYYGPRIRGGDLSPLIQLADRGFSPNPPEAGHDRTFSLDTLPQEYATSGAGDFRLPSIQAELADGSRIVDLRFCGYMVHQGKYALEGLPAFFAREDEADTLTVYLADAVSGLRVELLYGVLEDCDLITRAVRVVNGGEAPFRLLQAASLCLDFLRADLDLITFDGRHTMERLPSRAPLRPGVQGVGSVRGISSHQHNPFAVLCEGDANEDHGLCYGAMLLYSGGFQAEVERDQFDNSRLVLGIQPRNFSWTLDPGESFTAPEAALTCTADGLGAMSRQLHRAIRRHLLRDPWAGKRHPVLINNWEATEFHFDLEKLEGIAGAAAQLGAELFVLDDGWFGVRNNDRQGLGDWGVNEEKLPGGLERLSERVRALGLDFGVWVEPETVSEDSELYRAHPDWALTAPGRAPTRGRSQLVLDLTRPEVREYVYRSMGQVLSCPGLVYVKWDMNRALTDVWSGALPAARQGEVCHRYVLAVYELLERVRRDYPHLLIEGCAGGGGRFDAGMLYYTPQIWCSDNTDALDRLGIQCGTSFAYPAGTVGAHVSAVPNGQTCRCIPMETRGVVAMAGTFGYELDVRRCTEEEKAVIRRQIAFFKEHWDVIQNGDAYRLTDAFRPGPFTAWQQVSADRRRSLVSLVTGGASSNPPFAVLRLKGLDPELNYRINSREERWPGDALMAAGWPVPYLPGDYQALQLWLEAE